MVNKYYGIKPLYPDWNSTDQHCTERIGFRPDINYNFPEYGAEFLLYINATDREIMRT